MLEEDNISEVVWQNKLLEILPLIYPEYVCVLKEVEFINEHKQKRRIDFLLVDAGYIRVLELKRPFKDRMISKSKYRYNHYALRELNGSIMQVEKYLYHLTRNSLKEENRLSNKYKDELSGIKLKVVNAKGLIIAGRSNDLLERLGNIIKFFKKRSE